MYNDSPFAKVYRFGRSGMNGAWWALMAPGLMLSLMALAILIWPQLLAYMVASALLFAGLSLSAWGWSIRQAQKRVQRSGVYYEMM